MEDYEVAHAERAMMIGAGTVFVETAEFDCVFDFGGTAVGAGSGPFGWVSC